MCICYSEFSKFGKYHYSSMELRISMIGNYRMLEIGITVLVPFGFLKKHLYLLFLHIVKEGHI